MTELIKTTKIKDKSFTVKVGIKEITKCEYNKENVITNRGKTTYIHNIYINNIRTNSNIREINANSIDELYKNVLKYIQRIIRY